MIKRYFLSNIIIIIILNLLVKPFWIFGIDRNVQLIVGHSEYGLYSALLNMTLIFNILLDMGVTNSNNKLIASDSSKLLQSLPNAIVSKLILSVLYFSLMILLAFSFHYEMRAIRLILFLSLAQFLSSFLLYLRSNVSAMHDFIIDSFLSVLDKLVMMLICGILIFNNSFKSQFVIEWFVYAQIGSYLSAIAVALGITIVRYSKIHFQYYSFEEMKKVMKESIPFAILILLMGVYMRSDSLLLERMSGATQTGIYAQAYRLLDTCNILGLSLAGMLLPMFSRMITSQNKVDELVQTSSNFIFPIALTITANSLVYAPDIMQFLYHDSSNEASMIYQLVIACFPAFSVLYIFSTLLTAQGNLKLLIKISFVACCFSISMNLLFIPYFQAKGIAITALIVNWSLAFSFIYFSIKKVNLAFNGIYLLRFLVFFMLMMLLNLWLHYMHIQLLFALPLNAIVFFMLVYLFKFWKKETIFQYFKQ